MYNDIHIAFIVSEFCFVRIKEYMIAIFKKDEVVPNYGK